MVANAHLYFQSRFFPEGTNELCHLCAHSISLSMQVLIKYFLNQAEGEFGSWTSGPVHLLVSGIHWEVKELLEKEEEENRHSWTTACNTIVLA